MTENTNNLPQQPEDRNRTSGLLKKLGITAACLVPMIAYFSLKGYFDSQGTPLIESRGISKAISITTLIPAIGYNGQKIPFRYDNMDPGCFSTLIAIPLSIGLANICYSVGYSLGSMNK